MANDQYPSYHIPATSSATTVLRPPMQQAYDAASHATADAWNAYQAAQARYEATLFDFPLSASSRATLTALQAVIDATMSRFEACERMEHALYLQIRAWYVEQGTWYGGNAG